MLIITFVKYLDLNMIIEAVQWQIRRVFEDFYTVFYKLFNLRYDSIRVVLSSVVIKLFSWVCRRERDYRTNRGHWISSVF